MSFPETLGISVASLSVCAAQVQPGVLFMVPFLWKPFEAAGVSTHPFPGGEDPKTPRGSQGTA